MEPQEQKYPITLIAVAAVTTIYFLIVPLLSGPRGIPGPPLARFTKWWYFWFVAQGEAHHEIPRLHRKYAPAGRHFAPIIRLGPNMYSISAGDKAVYAVSSKMRKSSWYTAWRHPDPEKASLFAQRDIRYHGETRRKFQNMYALSSLLHYEELVQTTLDTFRTRLEEFSRSGKSIDVHHWLQCYAFDVIGNITYGTPFGFLDRGEDVGSILASLDALLKYSTLCGIFAWVHPILYHIMARIPKTGASGRAYIMTKVAKQIQQREQERLGGKSSSALSENSRSDFLDLVLDAKEDESKGLTPFHVNMVLLSNIIAGSDTTAVSLSSVMWYLTTNPRCMQKLRQELDQAVQHGKMSKTGITFKDSQALPYLQACIKEGLRVCSATGLPLWRDVPAQGAVVSGQDLPGNAEVGVCTWVAHFDQDVWGADAEQFRPERWIEASGDRLKAMEGHYMPFGLGARTCIGRHISYLEMCKVVPMIVSNFDLDLQAETTSGSMPTESFWFVKPTHFTATISRRPCGDA